MIFLTGTNAGVARAERTERNWTVQHVLTDVDVRCLAADPLHHHLAFAGAQGRGVLRSDDGGRTWHEAGLQGKIVKSLAASRLSPGTVYAGTKPALMYASRDGGATWTELESFRRIPGRWYWFSPADPPGYTAYVQAIALSPTDPDVILAGIEFGAVVRSTDGGRTWSGHRPGAMRDCHTMTFHAASGSWVYQGGAGLRARGAAFSRDAGETWTAPREGLDRGYGWAVAADPFRPEVWYVSLSPSPWKAHVPGKAEAYIFRSAGGAPWQKLDGGLPQPLDCMPYALLTDPAAPGHLYAGLSNGDVWHTSDHGETWTRLPFNLGSIHSMIML